MKVEHIAMYVTDLEATRDFFVKYFGAEANNEYHNLKTDFPFSVGSAEKVDQLTARLQSDGYEVISAPRKTGDGYYESCIVDLEGNQIELTI